MNTIDLLSAASHPAANEFYIHLLKQPGLSYDNQHQLWIAARAQDIEEILASPDCAVRPISEAVPLALQGTSAGEVFSLLIRMNEGDAHHCGKMVMQQCLRVFEPIQLHQTSKQLASKLASELNFEEANALNHFAQRLPLYTVASLLGFEPKTFPLITDAISQFVLCLSPLSGTTEIESASRAAQTLLTEFHMLVQTQTVKPNSLIAQIQTRAKELGWNNANAILCNLIGLLSQTYEASSGLISNALTCLIQYPDQREQLSQQPKLIPAFVTEACRLHSPVQNTRRFVISDTVVAGIHLRAGERILLLLAAANIDPAIHVQPLEFDIARANHRLYSFGSGRHACPGTAIALAISHSAIEVLLAQHIAWEQLNWRYRRSLNGRLPEFFTKENE